MLPVTDPGFTVGGRRAVGSVSTSNAGAFWQKRMRKQKNWVPFVGRGVWRRWRPLDPPMVTEIINFLTIRFSTDTCLLNIQMLCVQHRK